MNFFRKIFSSSEKNEVKNNLRELSFKNEKYFLGEIERINKWEIAYNENQKKYIEQNVKLLKSHYYANYTLFVKKIEVLYCLGKTPLEIKKIYEKTLESFIKSWSETDVLFTDFLKIISFSILLNVENDIFKKFENLLIKMESNKKNKLDYYLLWFLLNKKLKKQTDPSSKRVPIKELKSLIKVTQSKGDMAHKYLKEYLESWYNLNKKAIWYNSHKRQWGYSGYWSWETAAIVKIMQLDDKNFKDHPHYPYDMVHWKNNKP